MPILTATSSNSGFGHDPVPNGLSPGAAAKSGNQIYQLNPSSTNGNYWLKSPSGTLYQAYIKMDYGGGWISLNAGALGPYATPLTASNGSGGGNMLSGASSTPLALMNGGYVGQSQGNAYGCPGYSGVSQLTLNTQMIADLGLTQVRWKCAVTSLSNVTCGNLNTNQSNITIISGTASELNTCANPPSQYSQVNPGSFTFEAYGTFNNASYGVFQTWTACTGSMSVALLELYVR
jgi:hypothetical protein